LAPSVTGQKCWRIAVMKALNQRSQTATPAPQGNLPSFSDRSMI
jgi:hypothetical protein